MQSTRFLLLFLCFFIFNCNAETPKDASSPPAAASKITPADSTGVGHYASLHGLKMYYEIHGKGPALLLLHPGMGAIPAWPAAIEYFSKSYQVIAPEQMGHGRTADNPNRQMNYHDMAEDTAELLRQLKIESVYIIGFSDGGVVGLDLAINHPKLVRKLAASGVNRRPEVPKPGEAPAAAPPPGLMKFIQDLYERLSPDGPDHFPVMLARTELMSKTQPNFTDVQLAGISSPTLIIAGDHDLLSPEDTTEIWRAIPGAQLWIAPNSNHGLPIAKPELFNPTVDTFFKEPTQKQP